jgi:hypothetical protein
VYFIDMEMNVSGLPDYPLFPLDDVDATRRGP